MKLIGLIISLVVSIEAGCLWNCKIPRTKQETLSVLRKEKTALVQLYNATNGKEWERNDNWLKGDPCNDKWFGIVCSRDFEAQRPTIQKM